MANSVPPDRPTLTSRPILPGRPVLSERASVDEAIATLRGPDVRVVGRQRVSGGSINEAWRLDLSDGGRLFCKENSGRFREMFAREAEGLAALAGAGGPPVPRPLAFHGGPDRQWILLEWVEPGPRRADFWEDFGRAFARLHASTAPRFGFDHDNFIGATAQVNRWEDRWTDFFGRHRLGFQLDLARARGLADGTLARAVERVVDRLPDLLPDDGGRPALLHGDLWSGNFMVGPNGEGVLIDPAVYYGHPEADLAMTELFGRMDPRFYAAYHEAAPIAPGYEERRDLYNLYHVLNHLNLFGGAYRGQALAIARCFA